MGGQEEWNVLSRLLTWGVRSATVSMHLDGNTTAVHNLMATIHSLSFRLPFVEEYHDWFSGVITVRGGYYQDKKCQNAQKIALIVHTLWMLGKLSEVLLRKWWTFIDSKLFCSLSIHWKITQLLLWKACGNKDESLHPSLPPSLPPSQMFQRPEWSNVPVWKSHEECFLTSLPTSVVDYLLESPSTPTPAPPPLKTSINSTLVLQQCWPS